MGGSGTAHSLGLLAVASLLGTLSARAAKPEAQPAPEPAAVQEAEPTALQKEGQRIYVREGCMVCHEEPRIPTVGNAAFTSVGGAPSLRVLGGKYPDAWHYEHLREPRAVIPGSIMPAYPFLMTATVERAPEGAREEAEAIVARLEKQGIDDVVWNAEAVALVAYLQSLGLAESAARQKAHELAAAAEATAAAAAIDPTDPDTLLAGEALYQRMCAACHGKELQGGVGPSLVDAEWVHGGELDNIVATVRDGVVEKGMVAWGSILSNQQIGQVSAYVYAESR